MAAKYLQQALSQIYRLIIVLKTNVVARDVALTAILV